MRSALKKWLCLFTAIAVSGLLCAVPVSADTTTAVVSTGVQGDINGDSTFNMKDVLTLRKYLAGFAVTPDIVAADLNSDNLVNMKDVLLCRLLLSGYEVKNGTVSTTKKPTTTTKTPTTTTKKTTNPTSPSPFTAEQQEMLALVNAERAKLGLNALQLDKNACAAANVRAREIADSFSHVRPNGSSCFTALNDAGVSYHTACENISIGYSTVQDAMTGWLNSPDHKANILVPYFSHIGVGYDEAKRTWVQVFITKVGAKFPADPQSTAKVTSALLTAINEARTAKGLKAFTTNDTLQAAATTLAQEQGKLSQTSFYRSDGSFYTTILSQRNIPYTAANNHVGFCAVCTTLDEALNVWAPNGDYSRWLDKTYSRIGIGYDETTGYWSILTLN